MVFLVPACVQSRDAELLHSRNINLWISDAHFRLAVLGPFFPWYLCSHQTQILFSFLFLLFCCSSIHCLCWLKQYSPSFCWIFAAKFAHFSNLSCLETIYQSSCRHFLKTRLANNGTTSSISELFLYSFRFVHHNFMNIRKVREVREKKNIISYIYLFSFFTLISFCSFFYFFCLSFYFSSSFQASFICSPSTRVIL